MYWRISQSWHLLVVRRPLLALQADVLREDVIAQRLAHDVVGLERVERMRQVVRQAADAELAWTPSSVMW